MASDSAALKEKKVFQTRFLSKKENLIVLAIFQIGVIGLGMVGNALVKNLKREGWEDTFVSNKIYHQKKNFFCENTHSVISRTLWMFSKLVSNLETEDIDYNSYPIYSKSC